MKLILITIIILLNSFLFGQEFYDFDRKDLLDGNIEYISMNGLSSLNINLKNKSDNNIYVLCSHWYLDGLIDSLDIMFHWIWVDFKVNHVVFTNKNMQRTKRRSYILELQEGPNFDYAPSFIKIEPDSSQIIKLEFNRILSKVLELSTYNFYLRLNFFTEKEFIKYIEINKDFDKTITDENPFKVHVLYEKSIYNAYQYQHKIKLDAGMDESIRNLIIYSSEIYY